MMEVGKVAVLGAGKIGLSIAKALKDRGFSVVATAKSNETIKRIEEEGITATTSNLEASKESKIIIISVKPYQMEEVLKEIRQNVSEKIVISTAAGVQIKWIKRYLSNCYIFRIMPNINILSRESIIAISSDLEVKEEKKKLVESIFLGMGKIFWVNENLLDAITALSGSGPAFVCEIIDAFTLAGLACGIPRELSYEISLKLLEGTVRTLTERKIHPLELRDMIITPAGTTISGLKKIEERGVKNAIIESILEAYSRSKEISKMFS